MTTTPILILAAGASTRMRGADKLLEPVAGEPLLRRVAAAALATGAPVLVALPPNAPGRSAALNGLSVQIIPVPDAAEGMAASIRAGVAALPPGATGLLLLLADMPEITGADMAALLFAHDGSADAPILRATAADGTPGHPVLFPARYLKALSRLQGDAGARSILLKEQGNITLFPLPGHRALTDLDTPEDWAIWRGNRPPEPAPPPVRPPAKP